MNEMIIYLAPGTTLAEIERHAILKMMGHFRENQEAVAKSLGITAKTVYNKLQQYEKDHRDKKVREKALAADQQALLARARLGALAPAESQPKPTLKPAPDSIQGREAASPDAELVPRKVK